jgi:hypothetical protein
LTACISASKFNSKSNLSAKTRPPFYRCFLFSKFDRSGGFADFARRAFASKSAKIKHFIANALAFA